MRCALPCLLLGVALVAAACVGEDPNSTNDNTNDASAPDTSSPGDAAPGTDGGGGSETGPGDGVEGNVIDFGATPVENATVRINGVTTQTDAAGQFKFKTVSVPFDVDVVSPLDPSADGTTKFVMGVKDLTTRTPILHVRFIGAERRVQTASGTTNLTFSGNNSRLKVQFYPSIGLPVSTTSLGTHAINVDTYQETVTWQGKTTVPGFWYFLNWVEPTATGGKPSSFNGVARVAGTLTDGVNSTIAPMYNDSVTQGTIAGTATYPVDATEKSVSIGVKLNPADRVGNTFVTYNAPPGNTTISAPVPARNGISVLVLGTAKGPNAGGVAKKKEAYVWKANLSTSEPNVTIAFPSIPSLTSPVEGEPAMNATDKFKWTGGTAPYRLEVNCTGYKAVVMTMATEAVLPEGIGSWPKASVCSASITSYGHVTAIDSTVVVDAPYKMFSHYAGDGTMSTVTNAFTSAP